MTLNKTTKLIFLALLILSVISFAAIQIIDHRVVEHSGLELSELSQSKDQMVAKFTLCKQIVSNLLSIVS